MLYFGVGRYISRTQHRCHGHARDNQCLEKYPSNKHNMILFPKQTFNPINSTGNFVQRRASFASNSAQYRKYHPTLCEFRLPSPPDRTVRVWAGRFETASRRFGLSGVGWCSGSSHIFGFRWQMWKQSKIHFLKISFKNLHQRWLHAEWQSHIWFRDIRAAKFNQMQWKSRTPTEIANVAW